MLQALAHAAGQTWLSDEEIGGHSDLLTTLDSRTYDKPVERIGVTLPEQTPTG